MEGRKEIKERFLRGVMITITSPKCVEWKRKWRESRDLGLLGSPSVEANANVFERLWISRDRLDKRYESIPYYLHNFNKLHGSDLALEDLELKEVPCYADGKLQIGGETYKMINGKLYRKVRKRVRKKSYFDEKELESLISALWQKMWTTLDNHVERVEELVGDMCCENEEVVCDRCAEIISELDKIAKECLSSALVDVDEEIKKALEKQEERLFEECTR